MMAGRRLLFKFISALLLPISMFAPRRIPGTLRKNYNMTLVGLSLFLYIVSTVSSFLLVFLWCLNIF